MPKVSIIIPCFNVEKHLNRCMDTIVHQTLKDIEIILVDDKSPDKTPVICDSWAKNDKRVKVIHKDKNEGLGLARNSGLAIASGEYVCFKDSDDYFELDMCEREYNEVKLNGLDLIYTEFNVDEYPGYNVVLAPQKIYDGKDEIDQLRLDIIGAEPSFKNSSKVQCSCCKGLYSLNLIKENSIHFYSERDIISEDLLFNLEFLSYAHRVETAPWQFYHYCLNDGSLSHTYRPDKWDKLLDLLDVIKRQSCSNLNSHEVEIRIARTCIAYCKNIIETEIRRKVPFKQKIEDVNIVINTVRLQEYILDYPINKLPLNWMLFAYLIKYKFSFLSYIFLSLKK